MIAFLLILSTLSQGTNFVESHIKVAQTLASYLAIDINGDKRQDLLLVIHDKADDRRFINVHYQTDQGSFPSQPNTQIRILSDTVGFGVAECREEPGKEILLFQRSGVHSYSPTIEGYRNNAKLLIKSDILYSTPNPKDLMRWPYVLERAGDLETAGVPGKEGAKDSLLLPTMSGYEIWSPDDANQYHRASTMGGFEGNHAMRGRSSAVDLGAFQITIAQDSARFITQDLRYQLRGADEPILLETRHAQPAPVFADVDGDGMDDMMCLSSRNLHVFLSDSMGLFRKSPTRAESLPEGIKSDETLIEPIDLNGDKLVDLIVFPKQESSNDDEGNLIRVFLGRRDRIFSEKPDQVLKIDALGMTSRVLDVNNDQRLDLVVLAINAPFGPESIAGVRIERTLYVHLGDGEGLFERRPSLKRTSVYKPEDLRALEHPPSMLGDFNGDGFHDWLETTKDGAIHIHVALDKTLAIPDDPTMKYQPRVRPSEVMISELDDDETNDLIVKLEDELVIFVSE